MTFDLRDRRLVLTALAVFVTLGMIGGATAAWFQRHDTICADGKLPVAQLDYGMGQVQYRCHNGQIVKK